MKPIQKICFSSVLLFLSIHVSAYEIETHAQLSKAAVEASRVTLDPSLLKDLGIDPTQKLTNSKGDKLLIPDLFRDGARFEDNNIRPLFHFFDPLNDEGLLFFTSPTWALEDKGKIHLLQNYSFSDARDHLYKALTLSDVEVRQRYFGKTFETMGRVIHHIQDMAQPQHVRLDTHLNLNWTNEELPFENRSRYEVYSDDQREKDKLTPLFGLYPPVNAATDTKLTTARAFWHTGNGNGMGLAEFTNRNFVSAGTNFGSSDPARYTSPPLDPNNKQPPTVAQLCAEPNADCPANFLAYPDAVMTFYGTQVDDRYRPHSNAANPRASTESIFNQDLKAKNKTPVFSLNRFNFDAAHQFLIPRAVAYSAGLVNYFFQDLISWRRA